MNSDDRRLGASAAGGHPLDPEQEAHLLSGYVDGELEADQVARVEAYLEGDKEAREEVARLRRLKEVTGAMILEAPPVEAWECFWNNVYNRAERGVGWLALTVGAVLVGGYGLYIFVESLLHASEMPWYFKGGIFLVCFGMLMLLVSVIRERVFMRKRTRYKDVIR